MIGCIDISAVFEYCVGCSRISPFTNTLKCFYCGSDSPFGEYYDDCIDDKEIDDYIDRHTIKIGIVSEIKQAHIIEYISKLK